MREGWEVKRLGEVCELIARGVAPKYIESNGVCVLNQKCIRDHAINYQLARRHDASVKRISPDRFLQVGDVLVNSTGTGTLGRVAQVREQPAEPATVDTHVTIIRPQARRFYPDFFGYMLIRIEDEIAFSGEGTSGQTELARSVIQKRFKVSFSTSRAEQKRIVTILDEAFEGIAAAAANTEKNLANARELFESYLNSVFTQKGEGWVEKRIGEIAQVFDGPHATPKTVDTGPVFLGIGALQDGVLNLDETRHVTLEDFKKWTRRIEPRTGDVVFSYETRLGQAAIIPDGLECCLGRRMGLVRVERKTIDPRFFLYQYISSSFREFLGSRTVRGATVDCILLKEFPSFPIHVPSIAKQRAIVSGLDTLSFEAKRLETNYQQKLSALAELKQSVLQKAFAGELTAQPEQFLQDAVA